MDSRSSHPFANRLVKEKRREKVRNVGKVISIHFLYLFTLFLLTKVKVKMDSMEKQMNELAKLL